MKMDGKIRDLLQDSAVLPISQFFFICKDIETHSFAIKQGVNV